ncbi:MAG: carboxypeptidase-like regulatory domain-containing protein, partial [Capsulimonas sp.]|uniref:MSCRAMM family protein n=1 Tax=Capsulimonas sp. TaxID=2494211 RepID=UPI003265D8A0
PLGFPTVSVADTAENTLGVGSYDGQQYDLWRILSRGPVNEGILLGYGPDIKVTQPAVPALNEPAAQFTPSSHCVIWATPYTRDLLVGPGSFGSTITQTLIKKFLDSGGRLFVAGQDVAATLTSNGTFNNTPGTGFLPDYLGATYLQPKAATDVLAGISGAGHRVSFDAFFNYNAPLGVRQNFPKVTGIRDDGFVSFDYSAPSDNALILGHYRFANGVYTPDSRTDAPLNHQLFPGLFFGGPSFTDQNPEIAKIDTIAPSAQSQTDITFSGPAGLITHEDRAKGSRVVFSSFGLEGIGLEYYKVNNSKLGDFYFVLNQRPRLMHNIVTYLRTGTITGTITDTTGNNGAGSKVSGVLVYLTANENVTIPGMPVGRTVYSAITDANGNYRIDAVEPGAYLVHATKTGYSAATTEPFVNVVTANQLTTVNLDITPFIPGGITGKVTYKDKTPVIGADVLFTAPDGSIVSGQTNAQGVYTIGSVPPGTYTGVASKGVAKSATITITVASGITTANADFVLDAAASPGSLTGVVKNTAGTPLVGATVSATLTGASTSTTVTTKTGGTYSFPSLPPGVYKVTASFPPTYGAVTVQLTIAASTAATQNFTLGAAKSAQLGGLITSASGTPLGGLTVTATPVGGGTVKTFVTSPTATTSPLGTTTSDHGTKINWSGPLPEGIYDITVKSGGVVSTIESGFAVTSVKFNQTRDFAFASIHTFTAGLHMISSPYDYSGASLDSLFGTNRSKLVIWQPKLLQYVLDPTPPADGLHPGYGYWIRLPNAVDITVAGTKPTGSSVPIALYPFWNQIGNPGTGQVPITSLKFLNPLTNTQLTYAQASSAQYNLISPTIYGYDPQTNAYVKVTTLEPWQGYWIKAYSNTTVSIPIINATTTP